MMMALWIFVQFLYTQAVYRCSFVVYMDRNVKVWISQIGYRIEWNYNNNSGELRHYAEWLLCVCLIGGCFCIVLENMEKDVKEGQRVVKTLLKDIAFFLKYVNKRGKGNHGFVLLNEFDHS